MLDVFVYSLLGDYPWVPVMEDVIPALREAGLLRGGGIDRAGPDDRVLALANRPWDLDDFSRTRPHGTVIPFAWDIWPTNLRYWVKAVQACRPPVVFALNSWSANALREQLSDVPIVYVPQAVSVDRYRGEKPLGERTIGVLEYGRGHHHWHRLVTGPLAERRFEHRYSRPAQDHWQHHNLFPTRESLIDALGDSAISVCFPASKTHPEGRSQHVEALTARYLESLAAGCLLLGHGPAELIDLFGFDPVVPVDWTDPAGQLIDVLDNVASHQAKVDQALDRVREVGDWSHRAPLVARGLTGASP
jgi:hypothetical protein